MTVTQLKADLSEIKRALDVLFQPGDVVELRALDVVGKVHAGYFNDFDRLANEAAKLSGQAAGVYVVLNQINSDLLARSQNRMMKSPKNLTQDVDITRRRWLPIDVDAKRSSGISSTNAEHEAALDTTKIIKASLMELGFPADSILTGDSGNGGHVLIRLDLPNNEEVEATVKTCLKALAAKFDSSQVSIDLSVFNAARIWKLPGTMARKGDSTETRPHRIARLLDVPAAMTIEPIESLKALAATAPEPKAPRQASRTYQGTSQPFDLEAWLAKNGVEVKSTGPYEGGTRYILKTCPFNPEHTGTSVAVFKMADGTLGFKCQHSSCADKTWVDLRELKEPGYKDRHNGHHDQADTTAYPLTDSGNAERFINLFGNVVKYVHERKLWLLWDGKKWAWDNGEDTGIMRLAKRAVREIPKEATGNMSKDEYKDLLSWARQSESEKHLRAMVSLARNETGVTISIRDLNTDNYLFNVLNGTIDLHKGLLLPHNPEHLITNIAPVTFDPSAVCPEWYRFLHLVMNGNTLMIKYLRDITGYCLTGDNRTHIVPFCHGQGGNGKSTFWIIIRRIMGDYATQVDPSVFLISKQQFKDGGTRETLADLFGKRLVTATEIEENRKLSINLLKAIMGGEDITGDRKYEHNVRFTPTFKVILSGNNEPVVHDSTDGAWRRLKKISFTVKIPNPIEGYEEHFLPELSGILNWMLIGCQSWQRQGLSEPDDVRDATAEYRRGQDEFNQFLEDVCRLSVEKKIAKKDLKIAYLKWCADNGTTPYSDKTLRAKLLAHGISEGHSGAVKEWRGINLKPMSGEEETPEESSPADGDKEAPEEPASEVVDGTRNADGTGATPEGTDKTIKSLHEDELRKVYGKTGTNRYQQYQLDYAGILGMPLDQAVELWQQRGAPAIPLRQGETCIGLKELLSRGDISPVHLAAVKNWLQEHMAKG